MIHRALSYEIAEAADISGTAFKIKHCCLPHQSHHIAHVEESTLFGFRQLMQAKNVQLNGSATSFTSSNQLKTCRRENQPSKVAQACSNLDHALPER